MSASPQQTSESTYHAISTSPITDPQSPLFLSLVTSSKIVGRTGFNEYEPLASVMSMDDPEIEWVNEDNDDLYNDKSVRNDALELRLCVAIASRALTSHHQCWLTALTKPCVQL
jgi:hypothetical protein